VRVGRPCRSPAAPRAFCTGTFADFDTFLAELVRDRIRRLEDQAAVLRAAAGTSTVTGNLTAALTSLFERVAIEIVGLVTSRHELLAHLRTTTPAGVPLLTGPRVLRRGLRKGRVLEQGGELAGRGLVEREERGADGSGAVTDEPARGLDRG